MTEQELYTRMIDDIIRIADPPLPGQATWNKKAAKLHRRIHSGEAQVVLDEIRGRQASHSRKLHSYIPAFLDALARHPAALKRYTYQPQELSQYVTTAVRGLASHNQTVLSYHSIEICGSPDILRQQISEALDAPVILQVLPQPKPADYILDKANFLDVGPYIKIVRLPTVLVTRQHYIAEPYSDEYN